MLKPNQSPARKTLCLLGPAARSRLPLPARLLQCSAHAWSTGPGPCGSRQAWGQRAGLHSYPRTKHTLWTNGRDPTRHLSKQLVTMLPNGESFVKARMSSLNRQLQILTSENRVAQNNPLWFLVAEAKDKHQLGWLKRTCCYGLCHNCGNPNSST